MPDSNSHQTIIRGASAIDGTGADAYSADVAINDGRITEIENHLFRTRD